MQLCSSNTHIYSNYLFMHWCQLMLCAAVTTQCLHCQQGDYICKSSSKQWSTRPKTVARLPQEMGGVMTMQTFKDKVCKQSFYFLDNPLLAVACTDNYLRPISDSSVVLLFLTSQHIGPKRDRFRLDHCYIWLLASSAKLKGRTWSGNGVKRPLLLLSTAALWQIKGKFRGGGIFPRGSPDHQSRAEKEYALFHSGEPVASTILPPRGALVFDGTLLSSLTHT